MKKNVTIIAFLLFAIPTYCQREFEGSIGLSPAFSIGALSDYVHSGLGFNLAIQRQLKGSLKGGAEITFHKLRDGYDTNSFLSASFFLNTYFDNNYKINQMPIKPYLGLGLGLYKSQYNDSFYGLDPASFGLVISPRAGIRLDLHKIYISGEGRLHIATGYADSFLPLFFNIGLKF